MKKYLGIFLFAVFGLQSCASRDGEIIEMLVSPQASTSLPEPRFT
jgi:hypothetical protein